MRGQGPEGTRHPAHRAHRRGAARLAHRTRRRPGRPAVPDPHRSPLSHDAIEHRLAHHLATARTACPSLRGKQVTMHTLRHTAAMRLLHAGIDITVIALWLGHEQITTAQIYLPADMGQKERAIARVTPPGTAPGRYRPPDPLMAFLNGL